MMKSKKGQFSAIVNLGIGLAILAIVLTTAFLIMSQGRTQIIATEGVACVNSTACNATTELLEATATIPGWIPLVIIAVIGAALIGLVALFKRMG